MNTQFSASEWRLNSSNTHTHTHAHASCYDCWSQAWNSLENYDRWNSHALGILSSHFLALHKCGQLSRVCSCWATGGLRVSREVIQHLFQSGPSTLCSYCYYGQETVRGPPLSWHKFQSRKCYFPEPLSNKSTWHWKKLWKLFPV